MWVVFLPSSFLIAVSVHGFIQCVHMKHHTLFHLCVVMIILRLTNDLSVYMVILSTMAVKI